MLTLSWAAYFPDKFGRGGAHCAQIPNQCLEGLRGKFMYIFILYIVSLYISDALEKISSHSCRNLQSYMQQTAEHNFCEYHKVKLREIGKNHKFGSGDQNIDLRSNLRQHYRKIWSRLIFFCFYDFLIL